MRTADLLRRCVFLNALCIMPAKRDVGFTHMLLGTQMAGALFDRLQIPIPIEQTLR